MSQINHDVEPNFVPSNVQAYVPKPNGEKIVAPMTEMINRLKQKQNFGQDEVTIIVTGLPQTSEPVKKANRKLIQAYMQRYNQQQQQQEAQKYNRDFEESNKNQRTSSEEDYSEQAKNANTNTGDIIVSRE